MEPDIASRIRRIYSAIDATEDDEISEITVTRTFTRTDNKISVEENFRGGLKDEELSNHIHSLIHNIANLHDHLCRWATSKGHDKSIVTQAAEACFELQVIRDLSNNDKHGYPSGRKTKSGRKPKLGELRRPLEISAGGTASPSTVIKLGTDGTLKIQGNAKVIMTADILDFDNQRIGDLRKFALVAVSTWENLLARLGLNP
ncbi:MAG: hypothetical protein AB1405_09130 [Bdellovibrionota bacterium]